MFDDLGLTVEEEYKFHPTRRWKLDWCIMEYKIAIEKEGAVWTGGRHTSPQGFVKDMEKYNTATSMGYSILRFTPNELKKEYEKCLSIIRETIKNKRQNATE